MIPIHLDNIIFSLQKSGGISVVWKEHLERLTCHKEFKCSFLEYDNAELNFFRRQLQLDKKNIDLESSKFLFLKSRLNLKSKNIEKHLFHSSYYRTENGINTVNFTSVHDFTYEYFMKGFSKNIHSWQKKLAINNSQGIICVSENTKKDLLRFLPHISENKIRVIHNGVDKSFKLLENDCVFHKKHHFEDYSYALYVGDRHARYKNFELVVEACVIARIPLLIVGGGDLTNKELHNLKSKLGKENFKALLGISVEELNYYYNKAHCLLYPSLYEGFGIPVLEAQQAGCPVIATNSSSIPEVIGNKYMMMDIPTPKKIGNKIRELSFNNVLRNETIEIGLTKAKEFSWQNTFDKTTDFYKELYYKS